MWLPFSLFQYFALANKIGFWHIGFGYGTKATVYFSKVAVTTGLQYACRYHAAITTCTMHIKMLVGVHVFNPFVYKGQWFAVGIFYMLGSIFAFFAHIYNLAFTHFHLSGKLCCRYPVHSIDFLACTFPCLKATGQIAYYIIKTHTAQPRYGFFFLALVCNQQYRLFYIYNKRTHPWCKIACPERTVISVCSAFTDT